MLKLVYSLLTFTQGVELRLENTMNIKTFEDLQLEGPEGNKREVIAMLKRMKKVDMISNIADFDEKAIKFDDVTKASQSLLEKKDPTKAEEFWSNVIERSQQGVVEIATNMHEALHYEDRRQFFKKFTESMSKIHDLREAVAKAKSDNNETTEWDTDQATLNKLILQTDLDLEQLDDSLLDKQSYIKHIQQRQADKDFFKAALDYQEILRQRYQTFYLQLYADFILNQKKVSDGSFKMAHDFQEDMTAYSILAKRFPANSDKTCDPIPIWPDVVLQYCDEQAEKNGYGEDELEYCKCYNIESKTLTLRKPKTKGKGKGAENYDKIVFKGGQAPKDESASEDEPTRAMMDLGGVFTASSKWDANWGNPRLDSKRCVYSAKGKGQEPQWWQIMMPNSEFYEVSGMTIMPSGDNNYHDMFIKAVQFEYSNDDGKNWHSHNNGKWYNTGMTAQDAYKLQRRFKIDPPMHGTAFRVILDAKHKTGRDYLGRFDLWALKTPDFVPKDEKPNPKRAIMDLEGKFIASGHYDKDWNNPRLDSKTGIFNPWGRDFSAQTWTVDMKGDEMYEMNAMILKSMVGANDVDGQKAAITHIRFQFSYDNGKTWFDHQNGTWYATGQLPTDAENLERTFEIDPPMNGNAFRALLDHEHITGRATAGRFDFLVVPSPEFKPLTDLKPAPLRAMMDLKANFKAAHQWDNKDWNKPLMNGKQKGIYSKKGQGKAPQWWQVTMKGDEYYEVSHMSLKKHDGAGSDAMIAAVSFQFSTDKGKTWHDHEGGRWYKTNATADDDEDLERRFEIDPPMNGNAFRVVIDHEKGHAKGPYTAGRFDLWVTPNPNFEPEKVQAAPQKALMELGAEFSASSAWDYGKWFKPRLDSKSSIW